MFVFKEIDKSSTVIESNIVNYTQNLSTSSAGIQSFKITSGSLNTNYWNSLNVLFYTSGSSVYPNENKFGAASSNLSVNQRVGTQYLNKFHGYPSSSLITIPSTYYGEKIKEGTFVLTDNSKASSVTITDDGFGFCCLLM